MLIPEHIGFIMDGNGRWAEARGLPRSAGHKAGLEHIPKVLDICYQLGVRTVTGYAWSTENWGRPKDEVDFILRSLEQELPRFARELHARGARFVHSGDSANLPAGALRAIDDAVNLTQDNGPCVFNMAFNYGGRADIVHAARSLVERRALPEAVSDAAIDGSLSTAGLPQVGLVIRTGGDQRLSNFMLWQTAHACLFVTRSFWPDLTRDEIEEGIRHYDRVMRRS